MSVRLKLSDRMCGGEFLVSVQLDPPGPDGDSELFDAVNSFSAAGVRLFDINSSRRISYDSIMLAGKLSGLGFDVIPHVTLRDISFEGLANQILAAYKLNGVQSHLIIYGDPRSGDKVQIPQVCATEAIRFFNDKLRTKNLAPNLEFAAAFNQNETDILAEVNRAKEKESVGANFFMTQPVFSLTQAVMLHHKRPSDETPFMAGIWPLTSKKTIEKIWKGEITGVVLPERTYKEAAEIGDEKIAEWGIAKAADLIRKIKDGGLARGIYIVTPFKNQQLILSLIRECFR